MGVAATLPELSEWTLSSSGHRVTMVSSRIHLLTVFVQDEPRNEQKHHIFLVRADG